MKTERITVRLDGDVRDALRQEAAKQGIEDAVLVRMFVRDGLARYNAVTGAILQNTEDLSRQIETLKQAVSATLHIVAEQSVLSKPQRDTESAAEYAERLKATYRESVFGALPKGKAIVSAIESGHSGKTR